MPVLTEAPPLPDTTWLQVYFRNTGLTYRIGDDGRWLVTLPGKTEAQQPPLSRDDRGAQVLSARAMDRIRQVLEQVGFASLGPTVSAGLPPGTRLINGWEYTESALVFTVRMPDGTRSVEVRGDPRAPESLGVLGPLYTQIDREAIGGWAGE